MGNKKKSLKWKLYGEYFCFRKVGLKRLKKQLKQLEERKIRYLILKPSRRIESTVFLQATYEYDKEEGMSYGIEFGIRLKEGHNLILRNYPVPASQMEKVFTDYFKKQMVPDVSGWLFVNIFNCSALFEEGQIYWDFPNQSFQDTASFVQAVNAFYQKNKQAWNPEFTMVAYKKVYVSLVFIDKEKPELRENEELVKIEKIEGSEYSRYYVKAEFKEENHQAFTEGELLKDIQNQIAGRYRDTGEETFCLKRVESRSDGPVLDFCER